MVIPTFGLSGGLTLRVCGDFSSSIYQCNRYLMFRNCNVRRYLIFDIRCFDFKNDVISI